MKELLKYQEIDSKLRQAKSKLLASESRKKATEMQSYLKDSQNKLVNLDSRAGAAMRQLEQLKKEYDSVCKKIEAAFAQEEITDEQLSKLAEQLSRLEREINNLQGKLVGVNKDFENLMRNAKTAKTNLVHYKEEYDSVKAQFEPEIKALEEELAIQKKKVSQELLTKYNQKIDGKVFPIFVPIKDGHCAGCRMEVPAAKLKDLQNLGYIECENCGRYVYVEK